MENDEKYFSIEALSDTEMRKLNEMIEGIVRDILQNIGLSEN